MITSEIRSNSVYVTISDLDLTLNIHTPCGAIDYEVADTSSHEVSLRTEPVSIVLVCNPYPR